ncbi:hypothetical protein BDW59DRAFT_156998 [Aspergillus cavernicola]|uniref:holo-[acyl-carrier-protein] synthase n=1 Tax=Aspergillus cavernicola TaxID=176166 RepID=A0ABR4IYJ9_9EURO
METPASKPTPPPTLTRWYIDTRLLTSTTSTLPLLSTLQQTEQTTVQKFYHLKDKHMSLASNLLKYLFIHRICRVPWSSIVISRTPDPHRRPCFIPPLTSEKKKKKNEEGEWGEAEDAVTTTRVEFNVSHQASMVAIVGTTIPSNGNDKGAPEVGVDITCVNERRNRSGPEGGRSLASLHKYIDIFTEVFSAGEMEDMRRLHGASSTTGTSESRLVDYGYRLFYTYWALKEAYIKMTGEALLAPWLRELEFSNVVAPEAEDGGGRFGEPYRGVRTKLYNELVEDVRVEVVALEGDYLIATAARGEGVGAAALRARNGNRDGDGGDGVDPWMPFKMMDIERDIRPCAMGLCSCLS